MHFNLHKTFSVPHGGGGRASAEGVSARLADFLPAPQVAILEPAEGDTPAAVRLRHPQTQHWGSMKAFHGHFGGGLVRAYTYIAMHGADGLKDVSQYAVLNANYLAARLRGTYKIPSTGFVVHEFVMEGRIEGLTCARGYFQAADGLQLPPAHQYFPLIVHEALMIEPTETENKDTLDRFADALIQIAEEARTNPELVKNAPHTTPFGRMDEVKAAHELVLCCWLPENYTT